MTTDPRHDAGQPTDPGGADPGAGTDVAIVGMAGRFPGAAGVDDLWDQLCAGRSGLTRLDDAELRAEGVPEHLLADPDYVKVGAVIDGIELFDAGFFGVGAAEAQILDPQQRLFLEHSWHALEDAGYDPARFAGTVGVFGGSAWSTYVQHNLGPAGTSARMGELVVGLANDKDSLATRVAHTLGLTGPAYSVQSYCSTSLVAVCAAATSLANFECDLALAGGVAVSVPHRVGYLYQPGSISPPDGECRAFDAEGLGAPLGNGVGVVTLARLEDALARGDRVYAVLRGWAVNNDGGRKAGFTAPGVQGQVAVVAEALSSAGLRPGDLDYVEAHGTGTALGDAVELAALQEVFDGAGCRIGSVKTNVGHLDRAAGVTGLIKTALALAREQLPPTRNLRTPNPQLAGGRARLEVVTELTPWPRRAGHPRRAGVSAFGIGGTNAHVVLEEAPDPARAAPDDRPQVLVWSARTARAADEATARLAAHLAARPQERLADVAHTLQAGRRAFPHRRAVVAGTVGDAAAALSAGAVLGGTAPATPGRPVAFLVAGTGEQYPGLAHDLYRTEPVFAEAVDRCRETLVPLLDGVDPLAPFLRPRAARDGADLAALLGRSPGGPGAEPAGAGGQPDGTDTLSLQPATFAIGYAVARLLGRYGLTPSVVAGYSLGEYVAACLAGVLSLDDALALVAYRARAIDRLPRGAMAAVPLAEEDLRPLLDALDLDVGAVGGPQLTVVSGPVEAVAELRRRLAERQVVTRSLATSHAFHSRMLEPLRAPLTDWVGANVTLRPPQLPLVSNVTGQPLTAAQATDPGYWARHLCGPVRFHDVLGTVLAAGDHAVVELGPGRSLGAMACGHPDCPPARYATVVPTLPAASDPRPAGQVLAEGLARVWLAGVDVDWVAGRSGRPARTVGLPGYPFQRERYWIDPPDRQREPARGSGDDAGPAVEAGGAVTPGAGAPAATGPRTAAEIELLAPVWAPAAAVAGELPARAVLVGGPDDLVLRLSAELAGLGIAVDLTPDGEDVEPAAAGATTVVDLRALDLPGPAAGPADLEDPDDAAAVLPVAGIVHRWSQAPGPTSLLLATRGGQPVAGERPDPAQAAPAVLAVVAGHEYVGLAARAVDLDPAADAGRLAADLLAALADGGDDVLVAYRSGLRHVRSFRPLAGAVAGPGAAGAVGGEGPASAAPDGVRPGAAYLVTGGFGDVGRAVAERLARAGAGHLVLVSRRADDADPLVARLRDAGARVTTAALDVTDAAALAALLDRLEADGVTVDGVLHAAAQTAPGTFHPLRDLDAETVEQHFGAKVAGARAIARAVAGRAVPPRFCLLFSSTSSLLGGLAFGSYAAANAALTALALAHDDPAGTRWVSAAWDTWALTLDKLATGSAVGATMYRHAMATADGLDVLERLLAVPAPEVVVAAGGLAGRLPTLAPRHGGPAPLPSGERYPRPELPQPFTAPVTATERDLAELWSGVLGIEPVGTRDNFFDLGGNSLLALQMLTHVKDRLHAAIASVDLFEAPTVGALAVLVDARRGGTAPTAVAAGRRLPAAGDRSAAAPGRPDGADRRIAVIGMAGRFPGAPDVATFWRNLRDGVESVTWFTREELLDAGVPPHVADDPAYVPARPVLDDVAGFDAGFFGMSPRMAALTDPQQRLFLEVCWEALEQAGYVEGERRGRVGVFGGANLSTYLLRMPPETLSGRDVSAYELVMGNDKDALTTTASYLFDLRGPSVAVQTFCSTSLVATHLAVQALRAGQCELALAGGVSIRLPQRAGHLFGPGGQESPDGHVRTFDAAARGSLFGDGAAVVVLKPLEAALRDGDHVWSVIRGTAMNNDGALKVGFAAPSVVGQAEVVAEALADAGVTGDDIAYVEAHGTATELGDPIEVAALTRAFGETRRRGYCPIGSVKTNVGHLDRAAGVTGLIKTSLALHEGVIPPTLHFTRPNPEIDFEDSPFFVATGPLAWNPRPGTVPTAGVSSLGMGGTNAHVVVEQAPPRPAGPGPQDEAATGTAATGTAATGTDGAARRFHVLPVSARTEAAADRWCELLADHLAARPDLRLADVAYTLQAGRRTFEHRRVTVAASPDAARQALTGRMLRRVEPVRGRRLAFLFTGVGEQYPGMVAQLHRREPAFARALAECLDLMPADLRDAEGGLLDLLAGERDAVDPLAAALGRAGAGPSPRAARLARTEIVQPALFAVEYALARTLLGWGLRPAVMLGYSLGEYVAACLSGVLSPADAVALVAHRARLIATAPAGRMLAVNLDAGSLRARFDLADVDVAAENGPTTCVVAGPEGAVDRVAGLLCAAGVPARRLAAAGAFHSRLLDPLAEELTAWVRGNVTLHPPQVPYVSDVTGGLATADLVTDPAYWARHMCRTVRFADGVRTLLAEPGTAVVEIGPGQSLGALVRSGGTPAAQLPPVVATLPAAADRRDDDEVLADALARLWLAGADIDWDALHGRDVDGRDGDDGGPGRAPGRIPLPTYPFQRQEYWLQAPSGPAAAVAAATAAADDPGPMSLETIAAFPTLPPQDWFYLPVWHQTAPVAAPPAAGPDGAGHWLVYGDDGPAERCTRALRAAAGAGRVTVVRPGERFEAGPDGWTVRPGDLGDTVALLRALQDAGHGVDRVVHLWSLRPAGEAGRAAAGLHALVALARAAGEVGLRDWALDVVVAGTQEVLAGDVTDPAAAALAGPCLVLPLERPGVRAKLVDLDPPGADPGERVADLLVAELLAGTDDPVVALRHGRRWLPGYERLARPEPAPAPEPEPAASPVADDGRRVRGFRRGGVYLVTGGLGGIATGLARCLVRDLDARLVLLSRRACPEGERPEGLADAEVVTGDVTDPDAVRRAVDVALERFGALHGVLHAAGLPGAGLMQFKHPREVDAVLAPKVDGLLALAEGLRLGKPDQVPLDLLVLFSSIASTTGGGPGQVDYCAANAVLDAQAHALVAQGLPVVSVGWGEWTWNAWEAGLQGYDPRTREFFRANRDRVGIGIDEGWRALADVLATGQARVVVCTQDFPTMVRFARRFTVAVVGGQGAPRDDGPLHPRPELVTPYTEPGTPQEEAVAAVWGRALRLERVGVDDNYFELGGNSLLGVSIVDELRQLFPDAALPPHVLYETPTVAALAAVLAAPAGGGAGGGAAGAPEPDNSVRAQLRRSGLQTSADRRRRR